mmetsp:Transcript_79995/g.138845  ORF Transcript_79995/g.138845 Transcript_79995/m.138845 type:complete len:330 (-) Transcript_79995:38-1027(-)
MVTVSLGKTLILLQIMILGAHAQSNNQALSLLQVSSSLRRNSAHTGKPWMIPHGNASRNSSIMGSKAMSANTTLDRQQVTWEDRGCGTLHLNKKKNWNKYLREVYHEPLSASLAPLNYFEWFYYKSNPIAKTCKNLMPSATDRPPTMNTAWTTPDQLQAVYPIHKVAPYGFFVRREPHEFFVNQSRVEVLHVAEANESAGASWFWAVRGTGVFLELDALRKAGKVLQPSIYSLMGHLKNLGSAKSRDAQIEEYMKEHGATVLIMPKGISFLAEIVVRIDNKAMRDGSCVLPSAMLSTGFTAPRPCICNNAFDLLNCGGSGVMPAAGRAK